ncbi:pyridoxal phosphate-dependent aminotransferase [Parafilimonas sp.]|uniref:pyridoxal phosphate-dependent aminotransferase n=1 Tax=Parafilimonas sp. TaxID=1969739 RepID=UPI0039E6285A
MNRRSWLKKSSLLAGAAAFAPSVLNHVTATPARKIAAGMPSDFEMARNVPGVLKARLFANENPFGPSEKAKQAIIESLATSCRYSINEETVFKEKIQAHEGLKDNTIMLSAGSSGILLGAASYYSSNGGTIVTATPSYDDLTGHVEAFGGKCIKVPLTADYRLDLDAMEKAIDPSTKLVYICNPNNPTATYTDTNKLKDFCRRISKKTTVFIDEAYIDYMPDPKGSTMISLINEGVNIIVARTFSKLYGFAGLRVGYAIAQPETIKLLEHYTYNDFSLSSPAINAAIAAYQDAPYMADVLDKTNKSKQYLYKVLEAEGYEYIPSGTNFVLFPIQMDGERFTQELMKRSVAVRFWKFNNKNWCRVSIGRMDEMEAFAQAFKEIS